MLKKSLEGAQGILVEASMEHAGFVRLGSYSALLSPEPWLCPGGAISHLRKLHNVNISVVTLFILSRTPQYSVIFCVPDHCIISVSHRWMITDKQQISEEKGFACRFRQNHQSRQPIYVSSFTNSPYPVHVDMKMIKKRMHTSTYS